MTKNTKGLMNVLHQSINEAILESSDVAAAMAALKRTGKCPVFTIDITMQDAPEPANEPEEASAPLEAGSIAAEILSSITEELVLSDSDVEFLAATGISDPSWSSGTPRAPKSVTY